MIAVDYPGIGDSSPVPERKVVDWQSDVEEIWDAILGETTRFHLATTRWEDHMPWQYCHLLSCKNDSFQPPWSALGSPLKTRLLKTVATKWFLCAARHIPSFVSQIIVPIIVTGAASTSRAMVGSLPSSVPPDLALAKHITDYAAKKGQANKQQMVQLALGTTVSLPKTNPKVPITIFVGTKDGLVSQASCQLLVDKLAKSSPNAKTILKIVDRADHNSVMPDEYFPSIFATFGGGN